MAPAASVETDSSFQIRSKVWVEREGRVALSSWRIELLDSIEETGSLSAACERVGVPYRTAWYKLREMENGLGVKLLATQSGGAEGGGSSLTPEGREIVERFRRASRGIADLVKARFASEFAGWLD